MHTARNDFRSSQAYFTQKRNCIPLQQTYQCGWGRTVEVPVATSGENITALRYQRRSSNTMQELNVHSKADRIHTAAK